MSEHVPIGQLGGRCPIHDRPLECPACSGAKGGQATSPTKTRAAQANARQPRRRLVVGRDSGGPEFDAMVVGLVEPDGSVTIMHEEITRRNAQKPRKKATGKP